MKTGAPSGTRAKREIMSGSEARRQPCEVAPPTEPGVPWIAMRLPPIQPAGRFGWWPERARTQQPYHGPRPFPTSPSVTA
jgi:hypothetical protein